MKIYKLLFLVMLAFFAISCSQDTFEDQTMEDQNAKLAAGQFDNSHLGVYKGLFTTVDGLTRGSVVVTLSPSNEGFAQITLSSGEVIELQSRAVKLTADNNVSNLRFSSLGLSSIDVSLEFSVEANGANPEVSSVSFDNKESNILIVKNTSRLPATPITGTYDCTNCASVGVGFPNGRTWNVMSVGMGNNQTYQVQISYGGRVYTSSGVQNGCTNLAGYTVCGIAGTAQILGYGLTWNGTHAYDASPTQVCSAVSGSWSAPTYGPGITGTFTSDADCTTSTPVNNTCTNALSIACGASITGSTSNANNSDAPATCGTSLNTAPGVWYNFTSSTAQAVTIDTFGSAFDTKLGVFSGACDALVCVGGNDDTGGLQSQVSFNASAGTTYYVYVTGFSTDSGTYNLNVGCSEIVDFTTLTPGCSGFLVDTGGSSGNYSNNTNDTYSIDAGAGLTASLTFSQFNLENTWDFMRIYDGNSDASPQITMVGTRNIYVHPSDPARTGFTGTGANSLQDQTVTSTGRYLTVVFISDGSVTRPGFLAPVTCVAGRLVGESSIQKTSETFMPQPSPSVPKVIEREANKSKK